jgi:hypothetical protein
MPQQRPARRRDSAKIAFLPRELHCKAGVHTVWGATMRFYFQSEAEPIGAVGTGGLLRVKLRKPRNEHMSSARAPITDIGGWDSIRRDQRSETGIEKL